ncbi:AAA family ATPase [Flavobacterium inviolabile]|uniref:AAA family ATPase n=1 Tax=Flavobacterium inviolabile TaxID=2748320 RepID=UPI0015B30015|nr:AAA family ATPase [Flavobacterium inviolabile]
MLIGANGTGKSQVLELVTKLFNVLIASQEKGIKVQRYEHDFVLDYQIDGKKAQIRSVKNFETYLLNGNSVDFKDMPTPGKILASAINLNDRFPFYTKRSKLSNYLGIRTASNNAFKNHNTLIDRFSSSLYKHENIARYKTVFDRIGLLPEISVIYKVGKNLGIAKKDSSREYLYDSGLLKAKFSEVIDKLDTQNRFLIRRDKYSRVISEQNNLDIITNFFKAKRNKITTEKRFIEYDSLANFDNELEVKEFINEAKALQLIRDLELLEVHKLILRRKSGKYGFDQGSSGEHHILSNFINIIYAIEPNSLVMIDEPEISLHPNWQIQYMSLLQKAFSDYTDCHFIISTHSHFLVSDLIPEKSAVLSFHLDDLGSVYNETLLFETNGWSTENVLYRVFGVGTVRNHYLEMDLRELLSKISDDSHEFVRMREIVTSLQRFKLTDDDPLVKIIETAQHYLEKHGY